MNARRVRSGRGGVLRRLRRWRTGSFRAWARRLAGRLAVALVLAAFLPFFSVAVGAQVTDLGVCMRTSPETAAFRPGGDFDPAGPPRGGAFTPGNSFVSAAVQCAESFAATNLVPIGLNLWAGLAVIITIWTGVQIMFSGSFGIGEIVSLVLLLGFPFAVLTFYNTNVGTPWGDMTFSDMVSGMGQVVGARLVFGTFEAFQAVVYDAVTSIWSSETFKGALAQTEEQTGDAAEAPGLLATLKGLFTAAAEGVYTLLFGWIMGLIEAIARSLVLLLLILLFVVLLVLPVIVAYCSYLWGYFSLLVAIILGPLLIPWVLIPQLQFLAWGWFRTLLGAGVHMMVAGACFAVVAQILMIPIIRFSTLVTLANSQPVVEAISVHPLGLLAGTAGVALSAGLAAITESLPLILVAYLGAFKIGEITAMIMNGGSMPGSGLGDRTRSMGSMRSTGRSLGMIGGRGAATAAATAAAGVATGGAAVAAVAAGKVLSQATRGR